MSTEQLLDQPETRVIELDIDGMTCASCVSRVERKLGKLDGVTATVNLPLESARVTVPATITDTQITATVEAAGYKATIRTPRYPGPPAEPVALTQPVEVPSEGDRSVAAGGTRKRASKGGTTEHAERVSGGAAVGDHPTSAAAARLRPRLIVATVLTIPVFLISMFPAFQFAGWGWVAGLLALPVVTWAAWPFHRAAAINARHLASTMDTLVSIGVTAAYAFSAWQLFIDPSMTAHPGMEDMGSGGLYFEVAAVVTTFLLLGRYLEANAKQKAGEIGRAHV